MRELSQAFALAVPPPEALRIRDAEDELAFYDSLETNDSAVKVLGDETLRRWCPWPTRTRHPGKRQPESRCWSARRRAGGMVRVRAPISTTRPASSWRITTRLASQARRRDVSAGTCAPSSRTDCPG